MPAWAEQGRWATLPGEVKEGIVRSTRGDTSEEESHTDHRSGQAGTHPWSPRDACNAKRRLPPTKLTPPYNQPDFLNCRYRITHTIVIVANASG